MPQGELRCVPDQIAQIWHRGRNLLFYLQTTRCLAGLERPIQFPRSAFQALRGLSPQGNAIRGTLIEARPLFIGSGGTGVVAVPLRMCCIEGPERTSPHEG